MREHQIAVFLCYFASLLFLAWSLHLSWDAPLYADFLCDKESVLDVAVKGRLSVLRVTVLVCWRTQWCRWLRHRTTSQKVAGLIPDVVIGIFHWCNPSGCTMALGSTQPVTEMSTRGICWGVEGVEAALHRAGNLTTFMCWLSISSWSLYFLDP